MNIEKKTKLIYSGELIAIAVVAFVIGLLKLLSIIPTNSGLHLAFHIITLIGSVWVITDFFWTLFNKKRRAKNSLMDKIMALPLAIYMISFDIAGLVVVRTESYYQIGVPMALFYLSCVYVFQGIYHYYHPIPLIEEAIEEAKEMEKKQLEEANAPQEKENVVENKDE